MKDILIRYTKYNLWANTRLTGFLKKLDFPLLDREQISSFKTIRLTVYHIWDAEYLWYNRLHGKSFSDWPSKSILDDMNEFYKMFLYQSSKFAEYTDQNTEDHLNGDFTYSSLEDKKFTNSIADTILHAMNHSSFHRGQLITMLRNAGFTELSSTDYITFIRESKT